MLHSIFDIFAPQAFLESEPGEIRKRLWFPPANSRIRSNSCAYAFWRPGRTEEKVRAARHLMNDDTSLSLKYLSPLF